MRWSGIALAAIAWISGLVFGAYILARYGGALMDGAASPSGTPARSERLFDPASPVANVAIGMHFLAGAILLLLGPIQLVASLRARWPVLHRMSGRIYASAAILAGAAGLGFILTRGTIGGRAMNVAFSLYGIAMIVAAMNTARHARARRLDLHRAWAIRLFALAIGSWLYRIEYTAWGVLAGGAGHTRTFDGPFDTVMLYFFFVPNILLAELFLRARARTASPVAQASTTLLLAATTAMLAVLTWFLALHSWGPPLLARLS